MTGKKLGFIGLGKMASSILKGALKAKTIRPDQIVAMEIDPEKKKHTSKTYGIDTEGTYETIGKCEIMLLAVKPQNVQEVLKELTAHIKKENVLLSIAAGISSDKLFSMIQEKARVIRAMPNTSVAIKKGVIGLVLGPKATNEDLLWTETFFQSIGKTYLIDEKKMDILSAISGSGPAYFFYIVEAIAQAGKELGLDYETALDLTIDTFQGAAFRATMKDKTLPDLQEEVTSPKGSTAEAIAHFEKMHLELILKDGIKAAYKKNQLLGNE